MTSLEIRRSVIPSFLTFNESDMKCTLCDGEVGVYSYIAPVANREHAQFNIYKCNYCAVQPCRSCDRPIIASELIDDILVCRECYRESQDPDYIKSYPEAMNDTTMLEEGFGYIYDTDPFKLVNPKVDSMLHNWRKYQFNCRLCDDWNHVSHKKKVIVNGEWYCGEYCAEQDQDPSSPVPGYV